MPPVNLQNYVSVAERVNQAQADIRTIHADAPVMLSEVMGYIRVTVMMQDERSATGTASFRLDLEGRSAQATNPIEDCETSAIGRALAFLGFSSARGIASREEVHEARRREAASYQPVVDTRTPIGQPSRVPPPTPAPAEGDAPLCEVHHKPMRPGKKGGWYCPTKLDDDTWCRGRSLKPAAPPADDLSAEWDAIDAAATARRSN